MKTTQRCQIWGWLLTFFSDRWLLLLSVAIGFHHTEVPILGMVIDVFSNRWLLLLSVAIGVQHTEVPNLGMVSDAFFR